MADEEAKVESKVKAAVSSLGEGCSTLIAVYLGAVAVAIVITQLQRQSTPSVSNVDRADQATASQVEVLAPGVDDYSSTSPDPQANEEFSADTYVPDSFVEPSVEPGVRIYEPTPEAAPDPGLYEPAPDAESPLPYSPGPELDQALTSGVGVLMTEDAASSVNIRESPTVSAPIQSVGYAGDSVQLLDQSTDEDGFTWYYVQFVESGTTGWVHGDYIQTVTPGASPYAPDVVIPSTYEPVPPSSL